MLSGEFDSYQYWNSEWHENPYEIYEYLTSENAYLVKVAIKKELLGKEMTVDEDETTPVIERLLQIQKSEDKLLLNNFTLDSLLNDDDSVEAIFKNNSLSDELGESVIHPLQRVSSL